MNTQRGDVCEVGVRVKHTPCRVSMKCRPVSSALSPCNALLTMQPGLEAMADLWIEGKDNRQPFMFLAEASRGCGVPQAAWDLFADRVWGCG